MPAADPGDHAEHIRRPDGAGLMAMHPCSGFAPRPRRHSCDLPRPARRPHVERVLRRWAQRGGRGCAEPERRAEGHCAFGSDGRPGSCPGGEDDGREDERPGPTASTRRLDRPSRRRRRDRLLDRRRGWRCRASSPELAWLGQQLPRPAGEVRVDQGELRADRTEVCGASRNRPEALGRIRRGLELVRGRRHRDSLTSGVLLRAAEVRIFRCLRSIRGGHARVQPLDVVHIPASRQSQRPAGGSGSGSSQTNP